MDFRKTIQLPPGATNVQALVAIDNDFTLWVNGTQVFNKDNEGCAFDWNWNKTNLTTIPDNLWQSGTNLIAIQARDRGVNTGFDFSLVGPVNLVSAKPLTLVMSTSTNNGQSSITMSPSANQTPVLGQPATFTALVTDTSGAPLANIPVTFNVAGVNPQQSTASTNTSGIASFNYEGFFVGTDLVQASATVGTTPLVSTQTQVAWSYLNNLPPPNHLTLSPSGAQTNTLGAAQTFTVLATDGSGNPVANVPVTLLISIANTQQLTATTNSSGIASFSYSGTVAGTDTVEANANINGNASFSNLNTVAWGGAAGGGTTYVFTPQGWIGSPAIGTIVQGQVPIMLGSGVTLTSGTLKFFPTLNTSNVTVLNSNTTGTGPINLGTFDATLLANGQYTVQLQSTNAGGASQLNEIVLSVTGENKPGREVVTVTDFKIPLAGIPVDITRTYDNLNRGKVEDFGNGWKLGTSVELETDLLMNVTFTLNGKRQTFYFTPQSAGNIFFPWLLTPHYTPQPGFHGTLTSDGCGILIFENNAIVQDSSGIACFPGGTYQPTVYTYTDPAGRVYTMSSTGQLQTIKDLTGNILTFAANGITSSVGNGTVVVPFVRDAQNRITEITDLAGKNYTYAYDSPCGTGNLCSVTFPGTTTIQATYTYLTDHSLNTQSDPNSNTTTYTYDTSGRISTMQGPSVSDANGNPTQYLTQYSFNVTTNTTTTINPDTGVVVQTNNSFGKPLVIVDGLGRTTTYAYDTNQNLISQTDGLGNTTTYTYDANGNQTSVTDPLQNKSTKTYNAFSEVLTSTDAANSNTQTYSYDPNFNLSQVTDLENGPTSQVLSATYDSQGNRLTSTDANSKTTTFDYDSRGNLLHITDPLSEVTTFAYDAMDRVVSQVDPLQNPPTQFTYDDLGNLHTKTDPLKNVTTYTYDANGNKVTETDALSNPTGYTYDSLNRLTKITYPTSPATTRQFTYDFRNNKLTETDQSGHVTKYVYDLAGQLTSVTYAYGTADAGTVQYTYDAAGRQKTVKDELLNVTTNNYDAAGRLTSVQDATTNPPTVYGYDADNRKTSAQDPNGNILQYAYFPRNWLKTITYPATATQTATTTQHTYDGMGRVLTTTDQASKATTNIYDSVGRLTSVTDALGKTTTYVYDFDGNLQFAKDADGRVTTYFYDPLNRLSVRVLPANSLSETLSYDAVGNLSTRVDFNGKLTSYTYDTVNRLLQRIPDLSLSQPTITFTYTPTGKRASMTDASGTTNYTSYDNRDRLKTASTPEGTLNYTYDAHGNVLTIASSNTNGASMTYTYDVLNRLATAKDNRVAAQGGPTNPTTYSYDPASNLSGFLYPNTIQTSNTYDTLNRLTQTCAATSSPACSASSKQASFAYTLGMAGNRTAVAELNGRSVSYGYDNDYRLLTETVASDPGSNNGTETYTYDDVGNRKTLSSTIPALSGSVSYSYDANDRLLSDGYDFNGNTTFSLGVTNTYDFENHLMQHAAVTMVYDGDGNRVSETAGGVTTKYLVDTLNPTGFSQVVDEIVSGSVTRTYAYGRQRIDENQLVGSTWTPSFYGYDGHGNVRFLANTSGTVTDTYQFDAFGNQIASTGSTSNPYLYSGERFDSSLSLYHLRARYYNVLTGRFEIMDPNPGKFLDPATLHKYVYAANNPVNWVDPSGRSLEEDDLLAETNLTVRAFHLRARVAYEECYEYSIAGILILKPDFWSLPMDVLGEYISLIAYRCAQAAAGFPIPGLPYGMN